MITGQAVSPHQKPLQPWLAAGWLIALSTFNLCLAAAPSSLPRQADLLLLALMLAPIGMFGWNELTHMRLAGRTRNIIRFALSLVVLFPAMLLLTLGKDIGRHLAAALDSPTSASRLDAAVAATAAGTLTAASLAVVAWQRRHAMAYPKPQNIPLRVAMAAASRKLFGTGWIVELAVVCAVGAASVFWSQPRVPEMLVLMQAFSLMDLVMPRIDTGSQSAVDPQGRMMSRFRARQLVLQNNPAFAAAAARHAALEKQLLIAGTLATALALVLSSLRVMPALQHHASPPHRPHEIDPVVGLLLSMLLASAGAAILAPVAYAAAYLLPKGRAIWQDFCHYQALKFDDPALTLMRLLAATGLLTLLAGTAGLVIDK